MLVLALDYDVNTYSSFLPMWKVTNKLLSTGTKINAYVFTTISNTVTATKVSMVSALGQPGLFITILLLDTLTKC